MKLWHSLRPILPRQPSRLRPQHRPALHITAKHTLSETCYMHFIRGPQACPHPYNILHTLPFLHQSRPFPRKTISTTCVPATRPNVTMRAAPAMRAQRDASSPVTMRAASSQCISSLPLSPTSAAAPAQLPPPHPPTRRGTPPPPHPLPPPPPPPPPPCHPPPRPALP